jgi:chromate transporter
LPAVAIVTGLAWIYVRYGTVPQAEGVLYGVKPVIIAIILQALWSLGKTAIKTPLLGAVGAAGLALSFLGTNELAVLAASGAVVAVWRSATGSDRSHTGRMIWPASAEIWRLAAAAVPATATTAFGLWPLFLFFLKVGSILFGSGYVLLAFIRADLVDRWQWLTEAQLLDAVAVGQVTPGPLFTTAAFVGYLLGGLPGAGVATAGIFLPSFVFVAISGPLVKRIRRSAAAGAFLDGVIAGSLALMTVVTYQLGRAALVDFVTVGFAIAAIVLIRFNVNSVYLVAGGALGGLVVKWVTGEIGLH